MTVVEDCTEVSVAEGVAGMPRSQEFVPSLLEPWYPGGNVNCSPDAVHFVDIQFFESR